jgi:predicted nucleic acid-binding protein
LVFLDAGYLIALLNRGDQNREIALEWQKIVEDGQVQLLTTEFCLIEVVDFLSRHGYRVIARALLAALREGTFVTITPCSTALLNRGLELHANRDDKTWSLTDCISIVVMQDNAVTDILTFDHDFIQAGMRALTLE